MILWILQMTLNLVLSYFAFLWLLSKKRIFWLEAQIEILNQSISQMRSELVSKDTNSKNENGSVAVSSLPAKTIPDRGQLIEKFMQNDPRKNHRPSPEAYDRADQLLSRGMDIREVSKQTGLSIAELQLMGKVATRVQ